MNDVSIEIAKNSSKYLTGKGIMVEKEYQYTLIKARSPECESCCLGTFKISPCDALGQLFPLYNVNTVLGHSLFSDPFEYGIDIEATNIVIDSKGDICSYLEHHLCNEYVKTDYTINVLQSIIQPLMDKKNICRFDPQKHRDLSQIVATLSHLSSLKK